MEKLSSDLGLPKVAKAVNSKAQVEVDLPEWLWASLRRGVEAKKRHNPHIYDRHALISEPIYGPAWRQGWEEPGPREMFSDLDWLSVMLREFYDLSPVIVCCLPPWGVVYHNLAKTQQPTMVIENWQNVYWAYHAWVAHHREHITLWDYTKDDYMELLVEVRFRLGLDWGWR